MYLLEGSAELQKAQLLVGFSEYPPRALTYA